MKVVDEMKIGNSGWKPLHTGSLLSTLSFISLAKAAFNKGYGFLMGSRFSQDAVENIFAQIRKKSGMNPSALDARKALKLITVTQFMTPCSNTNYCSDSDRALLSFSDTSQNGHKSEVHNLPGPAGASVHAVLKKGVCGNCRDFLTKNGLDVPETFTKLSEFSDFGGLKYISPVGLEILKTAERFIKKYREDLLSANIGMKTIVKYVCDLHTEVPLCCDVINQLVSHYANVRGSCMSSYQVTKRKLQTTYGNRLKKQKYS